MTLLHAPAHAQERLQLEEGQVYTHPHTGIQVPATLGGISERVGTRFASDDLNVGFAFDTRGSAEALSVYIYRVTSGSVPVWFAQAQSSIQGRDIYRSPELAFTVEAFAVPGHGAASGLRAIYNTPNTERIRSTGVAMFATGEWYIKVRATSATRSAEQLQAWMDEAIRALAIPEGAGGAVSALSPIADCSDKLKFRGKSKAVQDKDSGSALNSLLGALVTRDLTAKKKAEDSQDAGEEATAPLVTYCRDHEIEPGRAIYRPDAHADSYLYAISDSGIGIVVSPDSLGQFLSGDEKKKARYSVTLHLEDRNITFAPQDRLPKPKRALELVDSGRAIGSISTWGENSTITIGEGAL